MRAASPRASLSAARAPARCRVQQVQTAEFGVQRLGLRPDVLGGQRRDDHLAVPGQPDVARPGRRRELGLQVGRTACSSSIATGRASAADAGLPMRSHNSSRCGSHC
jgi:hypothetical protein